MLKLAADGSWTDTSAAQSLDDDDIVTPYDPNDTSTASGLAPSSATTTTSTSAVALPTIPADETKEVAFIGGVNSNGTLATTSYWTDNGTVAHKWASATVGTSGGTITYSFSGYNTTQQATLTECLNLWSAVCNVTFQYVASGGALSLNLGTDGGAETNDTYHGNGTGKIDTTTASTSSIDPTTNGFELNGSFTVNSGYGIGTAIHEIGHVLGLGHSGNYNGSVNSSTQQYSEYDSRLWSIMSYISPTDSSAEYYSSYPVTGTNWGSAQTPTTMMALDILAVQEIYGAATSGPLAGGQTFGFNSNVAASINNFYNFTVNTTPVITIWDGGTGNTLDLSGYTAAETVNLNPGTFSSVDNLTNNICIAYNTAIDTAIGGTGNDTFTVNADADTITGGGGTDSVVFSGKRSAYTLARAGNTVTATSSGGVVDTLNNISNLVFSDTTVQASSIACYLHGTHIATPSGETPIQDLHPGDLVLTAEGPRPILWIGRRSYAGRFLAGQPHLLPILFRAGSLGPSLPTRDLRVSPRHAMLVDGLLIPAQALVNGTTIFRDAAITQVEYLHIELEEHGVLLAEGTWSESFLDDGTRAIFHNAHTHRPRRAPHPTRYCAPRHEHGLEVEAIRRRLAA